MYRTRSEYSIRHILDNCNIIVSISQSVFHKIVEMPLRRDLIYGFQANPVKFDLDFPHLVLYSPQQLAQLLSFAIILWLIERTIKGDHCIARRVLDPLLHCLRTMMSLYT